MPAPAMNADEIGTLLHEVFPQAFYPGCGLTIERVEYGKHSRTTAFSRRLHSAWRDHFRADHDGAC